MQPWKTLTQSIILNHSKFLTVEQHTIELPDGSIIEDWPWIVTPDFINVVTVTEDDRFLFFRQTKYCVEGVSLAPVGGYLEAGEAPLATAKRELLEETGYEAPDWTNLGSYCVDGNRGSGVAHLFLARGARHIVEPHEADLEEQELLLLHKTEVEAALRNGDFKVLPWAAAVALALQHVNLF